jgi:hypothetical protein
MGKDIKVGATSAISRRLLCGTRLARHTRRIWAQKLARRRPFPQTKTPPRTKPYFSFSLSFPAALFSSRNSRKSLPASNSRVHCS